jgi:hypothetical protein
MIETLVSGAGEVWPAWVVIGCRWENSASYLSNDEENQGIKRKSKFNHEALNFL